MENKKEILEAINRLEEQLNSSLKELRALRLHVMGDYENTPIEEAEKSQDSFFKELEEMQIPEYLVTILQREGVRSMTDLIERSSWILYRRKGFLQILQEKLRKQGIELNLDDDFEKQLRKKGIETRAISCIWWGEINSMDELMNKSYDDLFKIKGMGRKTLDKLWKKLHGQEIETK